MEGEVCSQSLLQQTVYKGYANNAIQLTGKLVH